MLILASRSPRRQALLCAAGIEFRVTAPPVEETPPKRIRGKYSAFVRKAALAKALSVAVSGQLRLVSEEVGTLAADPQSLGQLKKNDVVLGADTIVVCYGEVLGKPASRAEGRRMLRGLSGRWHRVYTGLALVSLTKQMTDYECTEVAFRRLSKREIEWYVETGEPMDKAGGYAIQGEGAALIRTVRGCYTNVIGLPMPKLLAMLAELEAKG